VVAAVPVPQAALVVLAAAALAVLVLARVAQAERLIQVAVVVERLTALPAAVVPVSS